VTPLVAFRAMLERKLVWVESPINQRIFVRMIGLDDETDQTLASGR
jgi:hypothetical protein